MEWLEADGLGGFASGTASGLRTRRYHALLNHAATPPTGRRVLVNAVEAWLDTAAGSFALSSHAYLPDVIHPDGLSHLVAFAHEPWPTWTYRLPDGSEVVHELFVPHGTATVLASWRLARCGDGGPAVLRVRPLLSGRDHHALHHENPAFRFDPIRSGDELRFEPYPGFVTCVRTTGRYVHDPVWFRGAPLLTLGERSYSTLELVALPLLLLTLWLAVGLVVRVVRSHVFEAAGVESGLQETLAILLRYALTFVGALVLLQGFGVDVRSLAIAASVLGVGIGFGLQNIANNFVSGVLINLERPIRPGDYVDVGGFEGSVVRVGGRSTTIRTLDGVLI
jgi:hypothetical protein